MPIEAKELTKIYGDIVALDKVGVSIPDGIVFGLLGPNGAGKTTLVRVLTSLSRPTAGWASVNGYDVATQGLAVRRLIGVVAQENYLDEYLTGRENLIFHAKMHGIPRAVYEPRIDELLRLAQLETRQHDKPKTYSGGMQRRLAFVRAMVHDPQILFLDEPTTGLDPQARHAVWDYIAALRGKVTVFLTTHYMDEADTLCDRVAIMDHGRILVDDTPAGLKRQFANQQYYEIELRRGAEEYAMAIAAFPFVSYSVARDGRLLVEMRPGAALKALLDGFREEDLIGLTRREPSLEEVFIRLTGRSLRE